MSETVPHKTSYRVYVEDTDLFGVLYHPRYLAFLERARTEFLREQGISLQDLNQKGYWFAIASLTVDYLKTACLDDVLTVETAITKKRSCLAHFSQSIYNDRGEHILKALIKVVALNKDKELCYIDTLLSLGSSEHG